MCACVHVHGAAGNVSVHRAVLAALYSQVVVVCEAPASIIDEFAIAMSGGGLEMQIFKDILSRPKYGSPPKVLGRPSRAKGRLLAKRTHVVRF